jgi:hypothetical protein
LNVFSEIQSQMDSLTNSINRMSVLSSEDEYNVLEQSYNDICCDARVLQQAKRRYIRYVNGIDDFSEIEHIEEMLCRYINMDVVGNAKIAFDLMKSIDGLLMRLLRTNE